MDEPSRILWEGRWVRFVCAVALILVMIQLTSALTATYGVALVAIGAGIGFVVCLFTASVAFMLVA